MKMEEMQKHLANLSKAHRRRFPDFATGSIVHLSLADETEIAGELISVDEIGFAIADDAKDGELIHVAWIEVIVASRQA